MNHKTAKIFGFVFPAILIAVMFFNIFLPDKKFSAEENRLLQTMPKLSISSIFSGRFETKAESYAADQFMLRNMFIKIKSSFDTSLGSTESNNVFMCKDNYLMENISKLDTKKMENNYNSLAKLKQLYPNINMDFMLVPNAANIMSDKLPLFSVTEDQNKQMDDFFKKIQSIGINPVDVRATFKRIRKKLSSTIIRTITGQRMAHI